MGEIKTALISVSDKSGLEELAKCLKRHGVEILSTGGTAKALRDVGCSVTDVADYTGFPEMMGGRVKTLHPKVHGGILNIRDNEDHQKAMQEHGIKPIDMVVVNLYPFEATIAKEGCTFEMAIENIDIGGPAMIRSAAKNHEDVVVVVDPNDYEKIINDMDGYGGVGNVRRFDLACKAFAHTAAYDAAINNYLTNQEK